MKKIIVYFVVIILISPVVYALEKEKATSIYREKLMIADFNDNSDVKKLGPGFTDDLIAKFAQSKRFEIVERSKMQAILSEQELQLSGLVNNDDAVKAGRLAGAKYIIYGSISAADASYSEYQENETEKDKLTGLVTTKTYIKTSWQGRVSVNARLIDIETGTVILGKTVDGKSSEQTRRPQGDTSFLSEIISALNSKDEEKAKQAYYQQMEKKMINSAKENASYQLVESFLKEFPLSGYIIAKTENGDYLIDLGTERGLNSKVNLKISGKGTVIKHPVTGEIIQTKSPALGYLKVNDVGDSTSEAKFVKGDEEVATAGAKVEVVDPIFIWHRSFASFIFPGLGQFLEKRWLSGTLFFLGEASLVGLSYYFYYRSTDDYISKQDMFDDTNWKEEKGTQYKKAQTQAKIGMWVCLGLEAIIHIWDTIDAGYPAEKNNVFADSGRAVDRPYFAFADTPYDTNFYFGKTFKF